MPINRWMLFIISLPGNTGTERMRLWRSLKSSGAAILRDGVYLLPANDDLLKMLKTLAENVAAAGGSSYLLPHTTDDDVMQAEFVALFNRSDDYLEWLSDVQSFLDEMKTLTEAVARRKEVKLKRDFEAIAQTDFFPNDVSARASMTLNELPTAVNQCYSADEPTARNGGIEPQNRDEHVARTWATRKNLWVDRIASAWLIQKFIDPKAKFLWLDKPVDCPNDALGFDFDGATFTHVGDLVTFEVLIKGFQLDEDVALRKIASVVHYLDVGGIPVPEADGLVAMLSGIKQQTADDDALLAAAAPLFDHLYSAYGRSAERICVN